MSNKADKFQLMLKVQAIVMLCFVIFMIIHYFNMPDLKYVQNQ